LKTKATFRRINKLELFSLFIVLISFSDVAKPETLLVAKRPKILIRQKQRQPILMDLAYCDYKYVLQEELLTNK